MSRSGRSCLFCESLAQFIRGLDYAEVPGGEVVGEEHEHELMVEHFIG